MGQSNTSCQATSPLKHREDDSLVWKVFQPHGEESGTHRPSWLSAITIPISLFTRRAANVTREQFLRAEPIRSQKLNSLFIQCVQLLLQLTAYTIIIIQTRWNWHLCDASEIQLWPILACAGTTLSQGKLMQPLWAVHTAEAACKNLQTPTH